MQFFASLIARNSIRSKRRTLLTVVGSAVSFCMIGVLLSMYQLFFLSEPASDQALRLVVRNKISIAHTMPVSYIEKIKALAGVRDVMIQQYFGGVYKDGAGAKNNFARFAVDAGKLLRMHPDYVMPAQEGDRFLAWRNSCVIGRTLAERLGLKTGDHVILRGDIFPVTLDLVVAGVYESAIDNELLFFHNEYLNESLRNKPDYAIMLVVMADNAENVPALARRIDGLFRNAPVQTKTESEKIFRLNFLSYLGNIKLFLFAVCISLAGTVLLVATNTIALSVRERAQEVGILKALGFSAGAVVLLIAGEAMLLSAVGGALGLIAANVAIDAMRNLPQEAVSLTALTLSPELVAAVLCAAALCGLAAALPVAWHVSRRPIALCMAQAD